MFSLQIGHSLPRVSASPIKLLDFKRKLSKHLEIVACGNALSLSPPFLPLAAANFAILMRLQIISVYAATIFNAYLADTTAMSHGQAVKLS